MPVPSASAPVRPRPVVLYLPEGGISDSAPPTAIVPLPPDEPLSGQRCPREMVDVLGRFCIDRYEVSLVHSATGQPLSPYYPPERERARSILERYSQLTPPASGSEFVGLRVPALPSWELQAPFEAKATSRSGQIPSSYLSGVVARQVCHNAGKRLCTADEWVTACRGQAQRKFPYGANYVQGQCNVFREAHPAVLLHGNASIHHLDPRLNLVAPQGRPLLRRTGDTPTCASQWGDDSIFDMVGNLDEWVDDEGGAFHGGFYARSTREGCDSRISSHPPAYFDYSLGTRCCR